MAGVSVIIVSYFTGAPLFDCLNAVRADPIVGECILVDNGNPLDVARQLRNYGDVLYGHGNIGFAAGCNLGARRASGDVLLFVNPDAVLAPGAVARIARTLQTALGPAIVGGRLVDASGLEQRGSRRDQLTLWRAFVTFTGLSRFERLSARLRDMDRSRDPLPADAIEVGAVSGALLAMRRVDFETLGGFDEGYFLHVEDIDLCRRCYEAGGVVLFEPRAHARHVGATSPASPAFIARCKARGFARYFRKFARGPFERGAAHVAAAALSVILPLRAVCAPPRQAPR